MNIWRAWLGGLRLVGRWPSLVLWVYLTSLAIAAPLAVSMRSALKWSIGGSLVDEKLRTGFDMVWYGEYTAAAEGLEATFSPSVVGILPMLDNFERLLDGSVWRGQKALVGAGALLLLAWTLFAGGILDRYANPGEPHSRVRFFSHGGLYFFRFLRLLLISLLLYGLLIRGAAEPLHRWVEQATRETTVERTVIAAHASVYALVGFLLMLISAVLDYAKIAMVVEKRHSAVLAFLRGLRFVLTYPASTLGLYFGLVLGGVLLFAIYAVFAPGAGQATWTAVLLAFLCGQAYLLARLVLKLWFLSAQTSLFLAHQGSASSGSPVTSQA